MYLIDSSAWIEYLRPQGNPKVKKRVREILEAEEAAICGIVLVEVLRGTRDEKTFQSLLVTFQSLHQMVMDDEVFERAAQWGCRLSRKGKTVPTTDLLISASAHKKATVVHADSDFRVISSVCGVKDEMIGSH
jgi:predicted nucleic acid-binding protein